MDEGLTSAQRRSYYTLLLAGGLYFWGSSFMLLLPKYLSGLGAGEDELGWVIGVPLLPFVLLAPLAGYLCDRYSAKRLALLGIGVVAISSYGLLMIDEMGPLVYALRVLFGAGHAFTFTPIFAMAAKLLSAEHKARGIAQFTVVIQLGNVLGSLSGSLMLEHFPATYFFSVSASLIALAFLACTRVAAPEPAAAGSQVSYRSVIGERTLWGGMLVILLLGGSFGTVLQFAPTYLDALYALGRAVQPIASYWFLTSALVSVVLARVVLARWVYRPNNGRILTACIGGLLSAALLMQLVSGPFSAMMVAMVFGTAYGLLFPAFNGMVLVRAPAGAQGAITGFLTMLYEVGFRGFGFVMGPVAETFDYFVMFYALAALLLAGFAVFFVLERERRRWWWGAPASA